MAIENGESFNVKFRGHETFQIRKGWLYKGLKNIEDNPSIFNSKDVNPSDIFGMGVSMVKALRYWLQAVGLTEEVRKGFTYQNLTKLGRLIFNYDKYMEETGTICLLHYKLATNKEMATAWYYFFNRFNMHEFTKEDFVDNLSTYLNFVQETIAKKTLEDDFNCILNTYLPKENEDPEDNMECPLAELGLIEPVDKKKIYKKTMPKSDIIPTVLLFGMIVDKYKDKKEIRIADILKDDNGIGKIFNLDIITLVNYLEKMQVSGYIQLIRTAGLDVIKVKANKSLEDCVVDYYESIRN